MMRPRPLHVTGLAVEHLDGLVEATVVRERAGHHDATLDHEVRRRRRRREVRPQLVHLPPPSLGAVAVHQDRVLVDGVGELDVRLELLRRRPVVAEAVLREPAELAHARRIRQRVAYRAQEREGLAVAVVTERVGRGHEPLEQERAPPSTQSQDLRLDVTGRPSAAPRCASRRLRGASCAGSRRRRCGAPPPDAELAPPGRSPPGPLPAPHGSVGASARARVGGACLHGPNPPSIALSRGRAAVRVRP